MYKSYDERHQKNQPSFNKIRQRYKEIVEDLQVDIDIDKHLDEIQNYIKDSVSNDYAASRGEYLCALIFAKKLGWSFIDAEKYVKFNAKGIFDAETTNDLIRDKLANYEYAVIGGFYGSTPDGRVKTFSRGGSDITGAIIARGVKADVYENWTDVNGFMTASPKIVKDPLPIDVLTYEELRELSYMGASVLHPESLFPLRKTRIPINIRNTFDPENKGTTILNEQKEFSNRLVTGIAGKPNYISIVIKKSLMNNERGFARKVLSVLENHDISMEHLPTGIDTMSVIVDKEELLERISIQQLVDEIRSKVSPDSIDVSEDLAMIAIVGQGMSKKIGTAARVFNALYNYKINVRMIDQGSSEMNIIVGVAEYDLELSISALYEEFFLK